MINLEEKYTNNKLLQYFVKISIILSAIGWFTYMLKPTLSYGFIELFLLIHMVLILTMFLFKIDNLKLFTGVTAILILIPIATTTPFFHHQDYKELLGTVEEKEFSKDVSPIDIKKVRVVDQDLAKKLGEKLLGSNPALGSIVQLGTFNIQLVRGELYWVAPLEHRGFFKWLNSEGTKGFVMVNATDQSDFKLIENDLIKYQNEAYFSENLHRHIYLNGYANVGITDFTFEIDEDLKPWYVVTLYDKKVGFSGNEAYGVLIVNPQTGEMKEYDIKNTPSWVDRIQPEEFIVEQINDYGKYVKGWFNSVFSQEEVIKTSKGINLVYGDDNRSYWYTGITSAGNDGSTIGFILVDTKTKEAKLYKQSGATETKAALSAEGEVQEKGYKSSEPILYNVLGLPTYVTTLKDNEGLVKLIALVSVEHYSVVGIGKNIKSALRNYKVALSTNSNSFQLSSEYEIIKKEGYIARIGSDFKDSKTFYYLTIRGDNSIYSINSSTSEDIILSKEGDFIIFEFEPSDNRYINIVKFTNKTLK